MSDEEDMTAQLLRLAGAPSEPSAQRTARARQLVHDQWRARRRGRARQRAGAVAIAAFSVAATIAIVVWMKPPRNAATTGSRSIVATGARIQGRPQVVQAGSGSADR